MKNIICDRNQEMSQSIKDVKRRQEVIKMIQLTVIKQVLIKLINDNAGNDKANKDTSDNDTAGK